MLEFPTAVIDVTRQYPISELQPLLPGMYCFFLYVFSFFGGANFCIYFSFYLLVSFFCSSTDTILHISALSRLFSPSPSSLLPLSISLSSSLFFFLPSPVFSPATTAVMLVAFDQRIEPEEVLKVIKCVLHADEKKSKQQTIGVTLVPPKSAASDFPMVGKFFSLSGAFILSD